MNWYLIFFLAGIALVVAKFMKAYPTKKAGNLFAVLGVILLLWGGAVQFGDSLGIGDTSGLQFFTATSPGQTGTPIGGSGGGVVSTYQPTYTAAAIDISDATNEVAGTKYYKLNDNKATVTAVSNVAAGDRVQYWVDNTTYWVKPTTDTMVAGPNSVQTEGIVNGSVSIKVKDITNDETMARSGSSGLYNTSIGANDELSIEIAYDPSVESSAGPFGGVMLLEYNSTWSSVSCTGDHIMANNPYHVTHTVSYLAHTSSQFAYDSGLDTGKDGSPKYIYCDLKNGGTDLKAGSHIYIYFIPADYYVSEAGDIVLDTEKAANGETTRTGSTRNKPQALAFVS